MTVVLLIVGVSAGAGVAAEIPDGMDGTNWMSYIPDSASLGELNIPGTHDSGMSNSDLVTYTWSVTQEHNHDVRCQFDDGCRWFDMRYNDVKSKGWTIGNTTSPEGNNEAHVMHGGCYAYWPDGHVHTLFFSDVVNSLYQKVLNTGECVILTLQCEGSSGNNADQAIHAGVNLLCNNDPDHFIQLVNGNQLPTLGEVRGKVIFISQNDYSKTHDHYNVEEKNPDDVKWTELVAHWNAINQVQNYTETHILSNTGNFTNIHQYPIVAFTSYYSWREASVPSKKMTERIQNNQYDFKQGNYYGVVLYNFVNPTVAAIIYQSNNFATQITKPVPEQTVFTHTGTLQQPIPAGTGYTLSGDVNATDVGAYQVIVSPNAAMGYLWADGSTTPLTYRWEIIPREIMEPELNTTIYEYSAGITREVELVNTVDKDDYTSTGTFSAITAGTYQVTVSLKDTTNTTWDSTGTSANLVLTWSILPGSVSGMPELKQSKFIYNESPITVELTNTSADVAYQLSANTTAEGVGIYLANVTLKDPVNVKWSDGSNGSVYLPWIIVPRNITVPDKLVENTVVYNGSKQQVVLNTTKPEELTNYTIIKGGNATAVGTYYAVVKLTDPRNNSWLIDTGEKKFKTKLPRVYSWNITPFEEQVPSLNATTYVFTGEYQTVELQNPSSGNFTSSGQFTGRNVSLYSVELSLNDKMNYTWSDGSVCNKTFVWNITPIAVSRPTVTERIQQYNGMVKSLNITPAPSALTYSVVNNSATDVGLYLADISLIEPGNRVWSDTKTTEDIRVPWIIRKDTVTIHYLSSNESMGTVSPASEEINITKGMIANGSTATAIGDNVFLYWNRSTGPHWNESESYVTLDTHVTPQILPVDDVVRNYYPTNYTAVFGSSTFTGTPLGNTNVVWFKENEGKLSIRDSSVVNSITLRTVRGVDSVSVLRNDQTVSNPPVTSGYSSTVLSIFNISAQMNTSVTTMSFTLTIEFPDATSATTYASKVRFWHHNGVDWDTTSMTSTLVKVNGTIAAYSVATTSLSPIGITIETANPISYTSSSSSRQSGSTQIMQEVSTTAPTVTPTVAPTQASATPTAKQTPQPTQSSPAPVFGLIVGLGAAAVLLRLQR